MRPRWAPQSSKLLIPFTRDGRFDSDTFPQMMKWIVAILCWTTLLGAQTPKLFWDGYSWLEMDRITEEYPEFRLPLKRAYVLGLLNGKTYDYLQVWAADSVQANALFRDYLNRFAIDELIRGADQFYQDPTHRYLPVVSALMITSLGAMGFPDSVVAAYAQASRDWINELTEVISEEVPVNVEGISMPPAPRSPSELEPPLLEQRRKWYNPDQRILP